MAYYHWGSQSFGTACVRAPASGWGGGILGYWYHVREREAAAGAAVLVSYQQTPPPNVPDDNNMIFRRIHNESSDIRRYRSDIK